MTDEVWEMLVKKYNLSGAEKVLAIKNYNKGGFDQLQFFLLTIGNEGALQEEMLQREHVIEFEKIFAQVERSKNRHKRAYQILRELNAVGRNNKEGD